VRVSETLGVFSVEDFLQPDELAQLLGLIEEHKARASNDQLRQVDRPTSVHSVPGVSLSETLKAYEPAGRVELTPLPDTILKVMDDAVGRALPAIRRVFPAATGSEAWTYLEYRRDQYITAHIDHPVEVQPDNEQSDGFLGPLGEMAITEPGAHVAGVSIVLADDYGGGEFFVETSASPRLWRDDLPELANEGADSTSDWFSAVRRTRWRVRPQAGGAVLYGTQLIHGTEPVTSGIARKMIGFFTQ
jgi:predicted 2-oxoglutarate/Fe(II)-dependent dioxygenase YbiX